MDPEVAERRLRAITRHLSPFSDGLTSSRLITNPTAGEFVNGTCFFKRFSGDELLDIPFILFFIIAQTQFDFDVKLMQIPSFVILCALFSFFFFLGELFLTFRTMGLQFVPLHEDNIENIFEGS
jgi:hypothetical protein